MSSKVRHIDFYPDEYIAGIGGKLSAVEQGVYWMICSLVYSRGGPIDDDHMWLSRLFADTHWRTVRSTIDRLIQVGKIERSSTSEGGVISVRRCAGELQKALTRSSQATQSGLMGGRPSNNNNDLAKPDGLRDGKLTTNYQPPTLDSEPEEGSGTSPVEVPADEAALAMAAYNDAAQGVGWPLAEKLTKTRASSLRSRLSECGGIAAFRAAMARASVSPFLRGEGRSDEHKNWRPDLDFFCKPKYFIKLIEGGYDAAPKPKTNGNGKVRLYDPTNEYDAKLMLGIGRQQRRWHREDWGPAPGEDGCRIPPALLLPDDGRNWRDWENAA